MNKSEKKRDKVIYGDENKNKINCDKIMVRSNEKRKNKLSEKLDTTRLLSCYTMKSPSFSLISSQNSYPSKYLKPVNQKIT